MRDWVRLVESLAARFSISQPPKRPILLPLKFCFFLEPEKLDKQKETEKNLGKMSFSRAKRQSIFDSEIKNKENLPGPDKYNPKWSNVS